MARLGDVATYINGYAFKPTDWSDEGIPIIRIQDLTGNSYQANRFKGNYDTKYEVNCGDVLISWSASLGVYVWTGEKAVLNQHIFKVQFDKVEVDKNFFVHQVERILNNASGEAHGATMKHLTKPVFDSLPFYLPNIEEQKKIANELNKVSNLISLRKQQLSKLDELVKSRFVELFGNRRENPFNYPTTTMGNVYKFQYGKGNNIPEDKGEYPCYGSNGVVGHHTDYNSEDSPIIGHIGAYAGIVNWGKGKHYVTYNGVICKLINDQVNPVYGYYLLQIQDYNTVAKSGAAQPFVSYKDLDAPIVNVPPLGLQNQFAAFVEQTDKSKFEIQKSIEKLETLKKALMQKYFG